MSTKKEKRPKLEIPRTSRDKTIDAVNWGLLALLIAIPAFYYGSLPDEIPTHFNGLGEPDSYGGKASIWIIPGIGVAIFFLFTYLMRIPHSFNFPVKITEENAAVNYRDAVELMRYMLCIILLLFVFIAWTTCNTALGGETGMNKIVFWGLTAALVILPFYYMTKARKSK